MSNILSLDLSSKCTGYCVSTDHKIITYGVITAQSTDLIERIAIMRKDILDIIKEYDISIIVIEDVQQTLQNKNVYKALTWLQGIIVMSIYDYNSNIQIIFMQASEWRAKIGIKVGPGIKRQELKQHDIDYIKEHYNITVSDDIADAICIMDAYLKDE